MVSVTDVQPLGDRLVVALGRFGETIAVVNADGQTTLLPSIATNTKSLQACGQRVIVTGEHGLTSAWSPAGELLWNAVADFKAILPSDDVIVENSKTLYRVSPDGKAVVSTDSLPEVKKAATIARPEGMADKDRQVQGSADGELLVAYRYDAQARDIQIYRKSTGKVTTVSLPAEPVCAVAIAADGKQVAVAGESGLVRIVSPDGATLGECQAGAYPRLFPLPKGGFAIGSSDGLLTMVGGDGKVARLVDLDRETMKANRQPEAIYAGYRAAKWLSWFTPPQAPGELPLTNFHLHLRDQEGVLRMVTWPAGKTVDFRWSDAVQGPVLFPKAGSYKVTVKAAAKYFDDLPMNQPSWDPILKVRDQVVKNERPAPVFTLYLNGKPVGTLTPEGGALKSFKTERITKGWSKLDPKPEEFTTFTGTIDVPAGSGQLAIAPTGMTDCWMTELRVE
jgi:hypothetical protein